MTMLAKSVETGVITREGCEARIALYKEQIGTGYIGIGKTLNEAKAAGIVPHGEWEEWATRTTGMEIRYVQRCMQAATEIRDGSQMARLEMSKALMLLSSGLDAETREQVAGKAADEGATVRELREQIKKLKLEKVNGAGAAAEIREQLKKAESEREQLIAQMTERENAWKARLEVETGKAYQRGSSEQVKEIEADIRKEFQNKLDYNRGQIETLKTQLEMAEAKRKSAETEGTRQWDRGFEAGRRDLEKAENELEKQIKGNLEISEQLKGKDREIEVLKGKLLAAENNRVEVVPPDYEQLRRDRADLIKAVEAAEKKAAEAEERLIVPADYEQLKRDRADLIEAAEAAEKKAAEAEERLEEMLREGGTGTGQEEDAYKILRGAVERFLGDADLLPTRAMELVHDRRTAGQIQQLESWVTWMREELGKAAGRIDAGEAVVIR